MDIILSTRNVSKAEQIRAIFAGSPVSILSLDEAGIEGKAEETGTTLEENGLQKAHFAWERSHKWSMSDDSGLFIEALGGEPGVQAATWAGKVSTEEIMNYTLQKLEGIEDRRAMFKAVATLISPDGAVQTFMGEVPGKLLVSPRVPPSPDMPYSSIFVPDGYSKSWTEMTTDEVNAISHRGQAFRKMREYLKSVIW
jgi:XTP/dITP diphosphohydrolase